MCKKRPTLSSIFFPIKDREKSSHQKSFLSPTATLIMLSAGAEGMRQAEAIWFSSCLNLSVSKWSGGFVGENGEGLLPHLEINESSASRFFFFLNGGSLNIRHSSRWRATLALTWHQRRGVLVFFIRGHSHPQGCHVSSVSCTFDPRQRETVSLKYLGADKT